MAKFPVEVSDAEGIVDAVNYVLSGPAGLGQNFAGVSFSDTGYLTGNFRLPFTSTAPVTVYVAPIALSSSERLDPVTWKFTFAAAEATPPFPLGSPIEVVGVTPSFYDGVYNAGVAECTTTYVIARTNSGYPDPGAGTGGTVGLSLAGGDVSTDGDARVTVNSATDRVFVSAQLLNTITYSATITSQMFYNVRVNRYVAFPSGDPNNPDFLFSLDATVAYRTYNFATLSPGTNVVLDGIDTIFTNIIDVPTPGYYRYILEVEFETAVGGDAVVTQCELGYRSLACQVVKE